MDATTSEAEQTSHHSNNRKMELRDKLLHSCSPSVFMEDAFVNFDTKILDGEVNEYADYVYADNKEKILPADAKQESLGLLASELYDYGGHTPCIVNIMQSFYQEYDVSLFLTSKNISIYETASETMAKLGEKVHIAGIDYFNKPLDPEAYIIDLYNQVITSQVNTLMVYIHMYDLASAVVCHLLQQHTQIKIIFCDIADHSKTLGMDSADLIFEARPAGYKLTNEVRGHHNNIMFNMQSKRKDETTYYSQQEKDAFKKQYNLTKEFIVLTGCDSYKLFDSDTESQFFTFVKDLLVKEKEIQYLIVTNTRGMMRQHGDLIKSIFAGNEEAYSRIAMMNSLHDFDIMFQSCDVFVDSFPLGSALTHIDCMRNKLSTIIKINSENPIKSFEFYAPEDYPYKFETTTEIITAITDLYANRHQHNPIVDQLYNYYLERYEFDVVKKAYKEIIELKKEQIPAYIEAQKKTYSF